MCPFSSLLLCYLFSGMGFVSIVTVMSCLLLSSATMEAKFSAPVGSKVMVMFVFIFGLTAVVHPLFPLQAPISNTISISLITMWQPKSCFVIHFSPRKEKLFTQKVIVWFYFLSLKSVIITSVGVFDLMSYFYVLDSETTEDEAAEPQISLEAKEGARGFQDEAHRVPAGKWHF